jgi:D-threonate/D-erythronate kinase
LRPNFNQDTEYEEFIRLGKWTVHCPLDIFSMTPLWTIISDDLTGLQAMAGEFARMGFRVGTGISRLPSSAELDRFEVYGFDTATRPLPAGQAEERVANAVRHLSSIGAGQLLKHNDSLLQGHIGLELRAVASGSGARPIVYAPACPNRRRVTRGGMQLELDESGAISAGGLQQDLRLCVSRGTGLTTLVLDRETLHAGSAAAVMADADCDVLIADAESDGDLDLLALAAQLAGCRVLSGSVGLAAALARAAVPQRCFPQPVVVVAGSMQAATRCQVAQLLKRPDCSGVRIDSAVERWGGATAEDSPRMREVLSQGLHCVISTAGESLVDTWPGAYPTLREDALASIRRDLRALLQNVLTDATVPFGGLVLAGGTTADLALRDVLHVTQFTSLAWLCEGMTLAVAADGARPGLPVVTKSGGWGPPDALCDAVDRLGGWRTSFPPSIPIIENAFR